MAGAGAIGAIAGSLLGKAIDFGFGAASGAMYEKQVRELRRTAYQDMMHSMKAAGLNPVLAAGASPGNSAAYNIQTGTTDLAGSLQNVATAKQAEAQAETAEALRDPTKHKLESEVDVNKQREVAIMEEVSNRHHQNAQIQAATDLARAQEAEALKKAGLLDVSAKEVEARTKAMQADNVKREQDAKIYEGIEGEILRRIEAYTGAVLGGRKAMGK